MGDRIEVFFDGGVRSGQDVLKALALGARGVFIGKAFAWALGAMGEQGVSLALEIIRKELDVSMALCGLRDVKDASPAILRQRLMLQRYAWMSVAAALATIGLKTWAWQVTGSVGMLSDALESLINLAAALLALSMLRLAAAPPDAAHPYGRFKAEYFASGIEGRADRVRRDRHRLRGRAAPGRSAADRGAAARHRHLGASPPAINLACGLLLISAGKRLHSIALEADGHHLMSDVWTSGGDHRGRGAGRGHRLAHPRPADRDRRWRCTSCSRASC